MTRKDKCPQVEHIPDEIPIEELARSILRPPKTDWEYLKRETPPDEGREDCQS